MDTRLIPHRALRSILLISTGTLLLAGISFSIHAQGPGAVGQTAKNSAPADTALGPRPVPESDIGSRSERARAALREIRPKLDPGTEIADISAKLPGALDRLQELRLESEEELAGGASEYQIDALLWKWGELKKQLDSWSSKVRERAKELEAIEREVVSHREVWELTRSAARESELPEVLNSNIDTVLSRITLTEKLHRERRATVLDLQGQISDASITTGGFLARIRQAKEEVSQKRLTQDSPRLWNAFRIESHDVESVASVDHWRERSNQLWAYLASRENVILLQLAVFLITLVLMVVLGRQVKRWAEDDASLETTARVFSRPVSAALIIALVPSYRIHLVAPVGIAIAVSLMLLPATIRILLQILDKALHRTVYVLVVLTSLFLIGRTLLPPLALTGRIWTLVVSVVAFATVLRFLRPGGATELLRRTRLGRFFISMSRLGVLVLAAAILFNIMGYVRFGNDLARTVINGCFFGLMLLSGIVVLDGLVAMLTRTRLFQSIRMVRMNTTLIVRRINGFLHLAGIVLWILGLLVMLNVSGPVIGWASRVLSERIEIGNVTISLGDILAFVITLWASILISRFIRFILNEDILPRIRLPRGVPGAISRLSGYVVVGFGFLLALGAAGVELTRLSLLAGAFGVGIGFGLQDVVNNFISGLILMIERPIQVGDTIEFGARIGTVRHIGIRSSVVRTFDGADVNVPNGVLISKEVVNWTMYDPLRRVDVPVGVAYGTDPNKVRAILLEAGTAHEDIIEAPEPSVLFMGFGESSLDFELRCWTRKAQERLRIKSDLTYEVHDRLRDAGIVIPFPQRDLHLKSVDRSVDSSGDGGPSLEDELFDKATTKPKESSSDRRND